jgi:hypothetical protein
MALTDSCLLVEGCFFREWTDGVVLRDSAQDLVVESHVPRLEIVAVGFETY